MSGPTACEQPLVALWLSVHSEMTSLKLSLYPRPSELCQLLRGGGSPREGSGLCTRLSLVTGEVLVLGPLSLLF